ncbi:hypothetical protein GQ43DRAFT_448466 [Delitschia confertaspora ATCC 74209]|uniref:DASH complex subunit DAM1 n=1 Tax=Delitschia confertaspora ATCC 74209 TaxID=1513339 RepID=A0A9P4JRE9_9PLEO|nr:hypothetical protein GQ43DRAFT_448466 [Delitschia confertaspora ATCC 74209]
MTSTTPSKDRGRSPRTSRPTTPLRPSSRSSLRDSAQRVRSGSYSHGSSPLDLLEPDFAELSDAMADLEANFMQLQLMHESLARFSESFASFLYGLNMNAFCVDFPEAPVPDSFKRPVNNPDFSSSLRSQQAPPDADIEATFLTTDTSFVENPPSSKRESKFTTPAPSRVARGGSRIPSTGSAAGRGRGGIPTRGGATRGARGGSGIARGSAIGRGRASVR